MLWASAKVAKVAQPQTPMAEAGGAGPPLGNQTPLCSRETLVEQAVTRGQLKMASLAVGDIEKVKMAEEGG